MRGMHWLALIGGYIIGSFFGLQRLLGMFGNRAG